MLVARRRVCRFVVGFLLAGATGAAIAPLAFAHGRVAIALIRASRAVSAVHVSWGDGRGSVITRSCAERSTGTVILAVPHVYQSYRHARASAHVSRLGCISGSNAHVTRSSGPNARISGAYIVRMSVHDAGTSRVPLADVTNTNAPGWVSVAQPAALSQATDSVVPGTPSSSGGCNTQYPQLSLLAGGPNEVQLNELSINTATCDAVVQIGAPASPDTGSPTTGDNSSSAAPSTGVAPSANAATVWESAGHWHSWYQDPPGLEVAGQTDHVWWRWNGGCVTEAVPGGTSGQDPSNSTNQHWYAPSGWGRNSTSSTFGQSCYSAYSQQDTVFQNNIFCAGTSTWVKFTNSYVSGRADGGIVGVDGNPNQLSGGCTGLLSYHSDLRFTENKVFIHN